MFRRGEIRYFAAPAASDFANSGKVTKAPFGNQGFQNLPFLSPWFSHPRRRVKPGLIAFPRRCR